MAQKNLFSDSDHRFAYFLHLATKKKGVNLQNTDYGCDYSLIALSRKNKRNRGSWSLKVTNFDEIRDGGKHTGNAEKVYLRFKKEWDANVQALHNKEVEFWIKERGFGFEWFEMPHLMDNKLVN